MLKLENENVPHSERNILIFWLRLQRNIFLIKEDMLYILIQMQLFGASQGKSVVIQGFRWMSEKVCPVPKMHYKNWFIYSVRYQFFKIPVNHQENGCVKWVQTRGYRACVFNMPIPLRVCLTGVST